MPELRFKLGYGPLNVLLVAAALLAAAAYFVQATQAGEVEPIVIGGRFLAGQEAALIVMYSVSTVFGLAGILLLIRLLRNLGREEAVSLDANRIVLTGLGLDGSDQVMTYAEIVKVIEFAARGARVIEVTGRDGSKIAVADLQFRRKAEFATFREALRARTPASAV